MSLDQYAAPTEGLQSSRLSKVKTIDRARFKEERTPGLILEIVKVEKLN